MDINVYNCEIRESRKEEKDKYFYLETDVGGVYCFVNSYDGEYIDVPLFVDKKIDANVTSGTYKTMMKVNKIIGQAEKPLKPFNKDISMTRIASINSAIKMCEVTGEIEEEKIFKLSEKIFSLVTK